MAPVDSPQRPGLSTLRFVDPQQDPARRQVPVRDATPRPLARALGSLRT